MTETAAPLDDYLVRLERAAAALPAERRDELIADVREHVTLALAESDADRSETVVDVLARLGEPEAIVAAELAEGGANRGIPPRRDRRPLSVEARALLLLTVGAVVLPFVGPVLGLWVASGSTRWSLAQKRTAALIAIVILAAPAIILLPMAVAGELTWLVTTGGFLLPFVPLGGILAAVYLVLSSTVVVRVSRRPS